MSLLSQASSFTTMESGSKREKMRAKMKETFQRIQQEKISSDDVPRSIVQNQEDQESRTAKVEQLIQNMNMTQPDNAGEGLANFESFAVPTVPKNLSAVQVPPKNMTVSTSNKESFMAPASYGKTHGSSYSNSYGPTPYYQGLSTKMSDTDAPSKSSASSQQLMEKLNYMIHLLEEQQKEPTQNIMEEFVLYGLLGIFMIYIVDSFARVGKYTR